MHFFTKNRDLEMLVNELLAKIASPFFTMILFGSHVKGTACMLFQVYNLFTFFKNSQTFSFFVGILNSFAPNRLFKTPVNVEHYWADGIVVYHIHEPEDEPLFVKVWV